MKRSLIFVLFFSLYSNLSIGQSIDSLLQVVAEDKKDVEHLKALNSLAGVYMRTDLSKAQFYQLKGISLSKSLSNDVLLSSGYSQIVTIFHNAGKADSALYYLGLLKNLALNTSSKDKKLIQANYFATGGLYYKKTGNLKKAISFIKQAIVLAEASGIKVNVAGQLLNLGNTYNLSGDYKNALVNHLKALKIFEEEKNLKGQSFCYQNISNSFIEMKQFNNALKYARKSFEIKKQLNDTRGIGTAEIGLGQIYNGLKKPGPALLHLNAALDIATNLKLAPELVKINFNLAKVYLEKKDTAKAIQYFNRSKQMSIQVADSATSSSVDMELIALKTKKQTIATMEKIMFNNIETLQKSGQLPKEATSYQRMAEYYATNQQYDKALEYTKKFYTFTDSINSNELQMQLKRIEEQYQLDKKEKEIAILKKDQQLQQAKFEKQKLYQLGGIVVIILIIGIALVTVSRYRAVHKARELLQMEKLRNGIARDLHDDIGSTLTSINILSKVLLLQPGLQEEPHQLNLKKIKDHSSTIMESMSDIVWAINPQNDTVEKVIFKMKEFAAEVLEPLNIEYEFKEEGNFSNVKLNINNRKDLFLIFKEAINNAAKYSRCSFINILLKHDGNTIQLQVKDNGQGFDQEKVRKGNGLQNILARSQNMLAALQYNTAVGAGTEMQLSVPSHD